MRLVRRLALAATLGAAVAPRPARGQETGQARPQAYDPGAELRLEAGVRAGYDFELRTWSAGAQLRIPVVPGLTLTPSADWFAATPATWQFNLDAAFRLGWYGGLYGGAGLAVAHRSPGPSTRTGLNVFAGFTPPRLGHHTLWPYLEARWVLIENRSPFLLAAGINVAL